MIQSMPGLEHAYHASGYAIEYDYFDPHGLYPTLETYIDGLFLPGKLMGQQATKKLLRGLLAGINAALKAHEKRVGIPESDAYLVYWLTIW